MSKPVEKPPVLASYLQPAVSSARLERNREAIRGRLRRPAPFAAWWWAAGAACVAALMFVAWGPLLRLTGGPLETSVAWEPVVGATLTSSERALAVALADGTRLELEPKTTLIGVAVEATRVELELHSGQSSFDVAHHPARQFRVRAGEVTVVVLGTRFSVERREGRVSVAVERGKVAVEVGGEAVYLTPGQRWDGVEHGSSTVQPAPSVQDQVAVQPSVTADAVDEASAPKSNVAGAKPNGFGVAAEPEAANPAKELFEASREARRLGDSPRAAQLLQQLVAQYPKDPRAGLAAFELGRIRADVLGDLTGAIAALEQALRLSPRGSFQQDALARLAQAYDRAGRTSACRAVRERYLAAHGQGVHAQRVLKLCP